MERRFCEFKQWRGVATRFDKLPVVFRAGVMCKAMVTWLKHLSNTP
ncbi:transposase s [Corynebacterium glutamicum MT]|nr:transposase s [Corynebacterium glutamicum MT]